VRVTRTRAAQLSSPADVAVQLALATDRARTVRFSGKLRLYSGADLGG
jgi:hypothetical protein